MSLQQKILDALVVIANDVKGLIANFTNIRTINNKNIKNGPGNTEILGSRTFTFGGTGTPAIGDNLVPICASNFDGTLTIWRLSCTTPPMGGNFQVKLVKSSSPTFSSKTDIVTATISGIISSYTSTGVINSPLANGEFLRLEILTVNGAANWKFEILQKETL